MNGWKVVPEYGKITNRIICWEIRDSMGRLVFEVDNPTTEGPYVERVARYSSVAHLAAAAPELLAALTDLLSNLERSTHNLWPGWDESLEQARAALTKATGGKS